MKLAQDTVIWRLDVVVVATTCGFVTLGLALTMISTRPLSVVAGAVTLALLVAVAIGYPWFRLIIGMLEDRLRGRGEYRFDTFISYRHREHYAVVDAVQTALEQEGLRVWVDKKGGVPRERWGLLVPLLRGLRSTRSVIVLVPKDDEPRPAWTRFAERVKEACARPLEHMIAWWHRSIYGIELLRQPSESWQKWEQRVAHETKVPLIWSVTIREGGFARDELGPVVSSLAPRSSAAALDVGNAAVRYSGGDETGTAEALLAARAGHFEQDIALPIVSDLRVVAKKGREIPVDKVQARAFVGAFVLVVISAAILGVWVLIDAVLDGIGELLSWPFRRGREIARSALVRLKRARIREDPRATNDRHESG